MAMDFNKALDTKASEIERPPLPPIGHYVFQVTKVPVQRESEPWQFVEFNCRGVAVFEDADDVDADELEAFGKVTSIFTRKSFVFNTEDDAAFAQTLHQLKTFCLDHLKIEGGDKMTVKELLNASVNKQFVGQLNHRPNKNDPEQSFAEIGRTAPLD